MASHTSYKLVTNANGDHWIVSGNPDAGYHAQRLVPDGDPVAFKRSWQAVAHCHQHAEVTSDAR